AGEKRSGSPRLQQRSARSQEVAARGRRKWAVAGSGSSPSQETLAGSSSEHRRTLRFIDEGSTSAQRALNECPTSARPDPGESPTRAWQKHTKNGRAR